MLANEVMENDFRYIFYDDEEAELLIEVGNGVWILLLDELEKEIPYFNIIYQ